MKPTDPRRPTAKDASDLVAEPTNRAMTRRGVITGGAAVTAVALIIGWIAGLFTGGGGDGGDRQQNGTQPVVTQSGESRTEPTQTTGDDATGEIPPEDGVLDVWIQDRQFAIRPETAAVEGPPPEPTVVPLETVIARAEQTTGNADGIRVRIFRAASSRASAEQALRVALESAGLSEHSLRWTSTVGSH